MFQTSGSREYARERGFRGPLNQSDSFAIDSMQRQFFKETTCRDNFVKKTSRTQGHEDARMQEYKNTRFRECNNTIIQKHQNTSVFSQTLQLSGLVKRGLVDLHARYEFVSFGLFRILPKTVCIAQIEYCLFVLSIWAQVG